MSAQRHFTMSTLGATIAIRQYLDSHPELNAESAITSLKRLDADVAANDFASGLEVHAILPSTLKFKDPTLDLQASLAILIKHHQPFWLRGFPYGRDRVAEMLSVDEIQCFRAAGLISNTETPKIARWWDEIGQLVRAKLNDSLLEQGRIAESLSYEYEKKRLASLGIRRDPIWVAINNNDAGFDILSYDHGPFEPVNRLIEVKSSTRSPPRMILTRGEWDAAIKYGEAYVFHLWALPKATLTECKITDVAPHIPIDQGTGAWTHVEIEFPAVATPAVS
jgi:hypothetical protein